METHHNPRTVICSNCGGIGHVYRACLEPISSFGIICMRRSASHGVQYLLVQRKDSLCFVEFVRGKYELWNGDYLLYLVSHMTADERTQLLTVPFTEIWRRLWAHKQGNRTFLKEYEQCLGKYEQLVRGVPMSFSGHAKMLMTLRTLLASVPATRVLQEREWGFPKGRRNLNEHDRSCALREFQEETGLSHEAIELLDMPCVEEVFTGCNGVRYRHVYYIAMLKCDSTPLPPADALPAGREIQCTAWFTAEEVAEKIPKHNWERRILFMYTHDVLCGRRDVPAIKLCFGKNVCGDDNTWTNVGAAGEAKCPPPPPPRHHAAPPPPPPPSSSQTSAGWTHCQTRRSNARSSSWSTASDEATTTMA
jgi:8-oxo-dGTP pyrophosphatase MutT (NUDIX family)